MYISQQGLHVTLTWNILHGRGSSIFLFGKTTEIETVFAFTCFACFVLLQSLRMTLMYGTQSLATVLISLKATI